VVFPEIQAATWKIADIAARLSPSATFRPDRLLPGRMLLWPACALPGGEFQERIRHSLTGFDPSGSPSVQIYESILNFANAFVLICFSVKKNTTAGSFLLRDQLRRHPFFTEYFRGDHASNGYLLEGLRL